VGDRNAILKITDVNFKYPQNDEFHLEIPALSLYKGECASICGRNGCGKTTLGKMVVGLLRPASGKVLLDGEDISDWELGKIGKHIGYLFQEPGRQIFAPTVLEDVAFPLILNGMDSGAAQTLARSILARFDMQDLENATTYTLSRGEKQRLAIAGILINNPDLLILDEPTTGLDLHRKLILSDVLQQLLRDGAGVLLISHDVAFVRDLSPTVYLIEEGRLASH